jgi:phosphomevalonate kinase
MRAPSSTAASAPGKVLLTGGYLVLDREYSGLVFGLNARIHVHVKPLAGSAQEIAVRSPQFKDALWEYVYHHGEEPGAVELSQLQR